MRDHWYCTRPADLSGLAALAARDDVDDGSALVVAGGARFELASARETVGTVSGSGEIALLGRSPALTVAGTEGNEPFSGIVSGDGTLVVAGGTLALRGADLRGLSRVVVESGATLAGTALFGIGAPEIDVAPGGTCSLRQAADFTLIVLR